MIYFASRFGFSSNSDIVFMSQHAPEKVVRVMLEVAEQLTKDNPVSGNYTVYDFFVRDDFWCELEKRGISRVKDDEMCEFFIGGWSLDSPAPAREDDLGAVLFRAINWETKAQYKKRQKVEAQEQKKFRKKVIKTHNEMLKKTRATWRETADRLSGWAAGNQNGEGK